MKSLKKKKDKKEMLIYGGESLKQCAYNPRGITVLTDSQIKCSANWIFPVFELGYDI